MRLASEKALSISIFHGVVEFVCGWKRAVAPTPPPAAVSERTAVRSSFAVPIDKMVSFSLATVEATALLLLLLGGKPSALSLGLARKVRSRSFAFSNGRSFPASVVGTLASCVGVLEAPWPWLNVRVRVVLVA